MENEIQRSGSMAESTPENGSAQLQWHTFWMISLKIGTPSRPTSKISIGKCQVIDAPPLFKVRIWKCSTILIRYFQPVVNPDGYEYTHRADRLWRKNRSGSGRCAGVDLNRNFGFHWGGKGTSNRPCSEIYGGPHAFSEPESAAQKRFFEQTTEKFHAFLTFHSYGQYILYPWGYDVVLPPDHQDLDRVGKNGANVSCLREEKSLCIGIHVNFFFAQEMRRVGQQVYSVGPSGSLLYPAAGASDDWAKSLGIKYTYTVELRDGGRYGFVLPASFIQPTAKEAFQFVRTVAQVVSTRRVWTSPHWFRMESTVFESRKRFKIGIFNLSRMSCHIYLLAAPKCYLWN